MQLSEIEFNVGLGELIRAERCRQGLTQRDVADKLGITFQQFQKYEKGTTAITVYRLGQISCVLEKSFVSYIEYDFPDTDYRIMHVDKIKSALLNLKQELLN